MESRVKVLGHPIHPVLVVFPLSLLVTGAAVDFFAYSRDLPRLYPIAHLNMGIGVLMGMVAAVFGWVDWMAIPKKTRAKRIGALHGVSNMIAVALFGYIWVHRQGSAFYDLETPYRVAEVGALIVLLFGGWLGGELVGRLGIGVDDDAHVNAPNSLRRHA